MTAAKIESAKHDALPAPHDAMARLLSRLAPVSTQRVGLRSAAGRVLAEPVLSDRPSPPCDVSAMDGYAVRLADLPLGRLPIAGEAAMGHEPPPMSPGSALRIFTGAPVPAEADAVIRREEVDEAKDAIGLDACVRVTRGQNIRRRGENAPAGSRVAEAGAPLTPATLAALAAFGAVEVTVYRRVRVAVLLTGDELLPIDASPEPWQIRDSNGVALAVLFGDVPWIDLCPPQRVGDEPSTIKDALRAALEDSDAVVLTGGVSMGDYDFVPDAVRALGRETAFHKVALRPGKPMLGAVGPDGQAILGLPGNPVSVLVTARRWAVAALRKRAGWIEPDPPVPLVELTNPDDRRLALWWCRAVRWVGPGRAELARTMGSGDLVSAAAAAGFVELPPDAAGPGPWPFYPWSLT